MYKMGFIIDNVPPATDLARHKIAMKNTLAALESALGRVQDGT
jgi:hypothetical protein|tara:strand:+ start:5246 stop:5374 length:129 start_codon:yes stop_codon:yes gene_type:complete